MYDRNSADFFDTDFYKDAFLFCRSYVRKRGGSEEEAGDVLQDAVEKFLNKLKDKKFKLRKKPNHYLYVIIKNTWTEKKKAKKESPEEEIIHEPLDADSNGIREKEQKEKHIDIFNRCLHLLNPGCIEALKMQKKGFSLEKMTKNLGLKSRSILQDKLYRCRQQLKRMILKDKEYIALINDR